MSHTVDIRPCERKDLGMLTAMERAIFGDYGYPLPVMRQWYDICGAWIRIAEIHGEPAGYILGGPSSDNECVWVLSLLVDARFRRRGVARNLLASLEPMAIAKGIREIRLTVAPSNTAGRSLYAANGYHESELEPNYFGPGEDRIIMVRPLT